MNSGLSNAMQFFYAKFLRMWNAFDNLGLTIRRTEAFLRSQMLDPVMLEIIDFKAYVLEPAITELQIRSIKSVNSYITSLLDDFMTAFIMFVTCLTIGVISLFIVGFKRLKRRIVDTNILLRIIPIETLEQEDRDEVIKLFRTWANWIYNCYSVNLLSKFFTLK